MRAAAAEKAAWDGSARQAGTGASGSAAAHVEAAASVASANRACILMPESRRGNHQDAHTHSVSRQAEID
jgi:hypothetical protein